VYHVRVDHGARRVAWLDPPSFWDFNFLDGPLTATVDCIELMPFSGRACSMGGGSYLCAHSAFADDDVSCRSQRMGDQCHDSLALVRRATVHSSPLVGGFDSGLFLCSSRSSLSSSLCCMMAPLSSAERLLPFRSSCHDVTTVFLLREGVAKGITRQFHRPRARRARSTLG